MPEEQPEVGGVLAGRGVFPVGPGPGLQDCDGWQRRDLDDDSARQPNGDGCRQRLAETRGVHHLGTLRRPSDAPVGTLDATEWDDVQALVLEP